MVDYNGALAKILKHVANEVQVLKATNQEKDTDSEIDKESETDRKNGKGKEKDASKNKGELLAKFMLAFEKVSKESEESAEKQFSHRHMNISTDSGPHRKNSLRNLRKGLSQRSLKAASMTTSTRAPESGRTPLLSEDTSYASSDGEISTFDEKTTDQEDKKENKIRKSRKNDRRRTSVKEKKGTLITMKEKKSQVPPTGDNVGGKEEKT